VKKILIANRGEIAVRIIRACRDMGIGTVAVYSACDRPSLHVRLADEAWPVGPSAPRESYLRIDKMIDVAQRSGADAVHPGYGFLAENEDFAAACRDAGVTFIGPSPEAIALMGSKTAARAMAMRAKVPVVPGTEKPLDESVPDADVLAIAERIGYPVMLKAVAGGGGRACAWWRPPRSCRTRCARRALKRDRRLVTPPCTSSAASPTRGTSKYSSSVIDTVRSCRSSSASARFRDATKR